MNMKRLIKYQLGLGMHEFYADACVKGPYGLLSASEQPLGMKGLQHLLVTFDEADLRPERGGSSLSTRMACPFVDGQNPQECHRIRNFNHRLTEADYNYLKEKCEKFLLLYDEWDYCLDIQQYIMGGTGLMIPMNKVEKFYAYLKEKNHVGKYFFANWDVFYRQWFEFIGFPTLTGDTVSGPVKKADMTSWKNFRAAMRAEGAFDFRQKN